MTYPPASAGDGMPPTDPYEPYAGQPYGEVPYGQPYGAAPYGTQPYGAQPYGAYPPPYGGYGFVQSVGTNGMAIASMVLGILWIYWIGSILALVFGYIARSQIKRSNQQGGGMAVAGIVLGWIGVATAIAVIVAVVGFADSDSSCTDSYGYSTSC